MQIAANLIGDHEGSNRLNFGWEQATVNWSAVGRLSETHRTAFSPAICRRLGLRGIAAVTGLSEGTVKTHLF